MDRNTRIFVAGHRGLVGSAILRRLQAAGFAQLLTRSHGELDLTDQAATRAFFAAERPDYVILAAAKVGGIQANVTFPADFIRDNLAIEANVIHEAWRAGVRQMLFLGSSCIYPRDCPQPIKEEYLLTGPLEATNRPYALAKIAGIEMCWAYNRQYGTRYLAAMPTNLYGPGDNFDLANSHVLPALIRKFHEARQRGDDQAIVWGSGKPRREFLHSDDLADAVLMLMEASPAVLDRLLPGDAPPLLNIGCGEDLTIAELAELVKQATGFGGRIEFDPSKPDGTPRKLLDVSRLFSLGWRPRIPLAAGIAAAYDDYLESVPTSHGY